MSEWVDIPLAVQEGEGESAYASDAELINLMLVPNPPGSRKPYHIASTPVLASGGTQPSGTAKIRGACRRGDTGQIYLVKGTTIYYGNSGTWSSTGTMPGTEYCRMVDAATHMVIVDGTNARCVKYSDGSVATPSIQGWIDCAYMDGYTIYADLGSTSFYVSASDDPTTVNALDFTNADAVGGAIVGLATIGRELFVVKNNSIECYFNAGGSGFPFQRSSPGFIEATCWPSWYATDELLRGVNGICAFDGALYWMSQDLRVYEMRGYQARRISSPWVEKYLRDNYSAATYVFGSAYNLDGCAFYCLSFKAGSELALVYDITNGLWHRRTSSLSTADFMTRAVLDDDGTTAVVAEDSSTGNSVLYTLDPDGTNDTGASSQLTRTITFPQIDNGATRTFMYELLLDMEKPATTGTITASWSDDGGVTYNTGIANTGASARTRWQRLGSFYQRILRITFSIASKLAIMGVRARVEAGE